MKQFEIPAFYRSPIISKVKARRKLDDPRKQDFSPTRLQFSKVEFIIARHFGFCYGVENAIEKSYKAIQDHPDKRIFLLSQMIHNPDVNEDLLAQGVKFLQTPAGEQLIPFSELTSNDIIIIPAFGTTVAIAEEIRATGANIDSYNTTCPFVEKVWNRSQKLGETDHTIIIHGKHDHEETRATFSHSNQTAASLVIKDMIEAEFLGEVMMGKKTENEFYSYFDGKYSPGFSPALHLNKIGVVNQTTMLASETQQITDYLRGVLIQKYGEAAIKTHMADTRDTLCYATNDNQSSTYALAETSPDLAIVVGGYNSSNTTHLVEILEKSIPTFFIKGADELLSNNQIRAFNIHNKTIEEQRFLPKNYPLKIAITSGASCPDAIVDRVMMKILDLVEEPCTIDEAMERATF
ncbi:MAG: 4-hydroxy-3-methylbut-2-enyl diphosphate reductase [Flavobacteriales bacterium]|jgi:4-hydroxy-3-methylbut-2-enyl diphosphate reductase